MHGVSCQENLIKNRIHTVLIFLAMTLLLAYLGWATMGSMGIAIIAGSGIIIMAITPAIPPPLLMRWLHGKPLMPGELPVLDHVTAQLSAQAGLKQVPKLYLLPTAEINAFAHGATTDSAIALSIGLLRTLDRRELVSVLAHEVSHIARGDVRVMALAGLFSRLTSALAIFGFILLLLYIPVSIAEASPFPWLLTLVLILAPYGSNLLQSALSRTREYGADSLAAVLTGDPKGLASALITLEQVRRGNFWQRLFFPGTRESGPRWLQSHPATKERITRLQHMEPQPIPTIRRDCLKGKRLSSFPTD